MDTEEMDEAVWERRHRIVTDVFDQMAFRPGVAVTLDFAVTVTCDDVIDIYTGEPQRMAWVDEDQGEQLFNAIADPAVPDEALPGLAARAAFTACVNNDIHELCEHFRVDDTLVFDPHPNGGRWESSSIEVRLNFDDDPAPRYPYQAPDGEYLDISDAAATRAAEALIARTSCGTAQYKVHGHHLAHVDQYPDRENGAERREFFWSREWLGEYTVPTAGNPGAALRSAIVTDMFTLAAESVVHEVAEWLTVAGERIFDPHPGPHQQRDQVRPQVIFHATPFIPARPGAEPVVQLAAA